MFPFCDVWSRKPTTRSARNEHVGKKDFKELCGIPWSLPVVDNPPHGTMSGVY